MSISDLFPVPVSDLAAALSAPTSAFALSISIFSAVLSLRSDYRARESVRPYLSTGVHLVPDDMSVSLSNYGAGLAIITKISMQRGEGPSVKSLGPLLRPSKSYEAHRVIDFVQKEYCLRPGDKLMLAVAERKTADALRDWSDALDGITIVIEYQDLFRKKFHYDRDLSPDKQG